jgi:hypothetical protein
VSPHGLLRIKTTKTSRWQYIVSFPNYSFLYSLDGAPFPLGGDNFDDQVLAGGTTFVDKEYIIGSIKKSHHYSLSEHYGWIFFDLVRPDRYRIHLQLFIHLKHKGIDRVLLGKLDLDSSFDDPMPSGELGQVVFDKDADVDQVKFVITDDIKNVTNVDITAAKKASKLFPGKGIETSSYVSQQFSVISLIVGFVHQLCRIYT